MHLGNRDLISSRLGEGIGRLEDAGNGGLQCVVHILGGLIRGLSRERRPGGLHHRMVLEQPAADAAPAAQ